jgi:NADH-quinone oxidoreductase subunit F
VFEAEQEAGGMLVQTIPAYRLPRKALAREIRMIRSLGVTIETGARLGRDFTLQALRDQGCEAVFLAVGAPLGTKLGLPGEEAEGVVDGVRYLRDFNLHGRVPTGRKVAVIGGGNVAVDVARTALRLGAESVKVLYRRTREEMPAWKEEVEEALREGVQIEFLAAPRAIVTEGGRATGVRCVRMELGEFDRSGRRRPREKAGEEFVVAADQVVAAIGQSVNAAELVDGVGIKLGRGNVIEVNPLTGQTSAEWVFAGGDAVLGPASVIEAIAHGERAAAGMDRFLTGADHAFWRQAKGADTFFDPHADPVATPRAAIPLLPVGKRRGSFREVEGAWSEQTACGEARRCLRCDYREKTPEQPAQR